MAAVEDPDDGAVRVLVRLAGLEVTAGEQEVLGQGFGAARAGVRLLEQLIGSDAEKKAEAAS